MIKRFHEAPKSIFRDVQIRTDGDYFLVHLFEEDPEYLKLAEESVASGRETILDNSIFELGEAFDMQKFADWVNKLKPTYYIVPDVLDDTRGTISNMSKWCKEYKSQIDPSCKMIGVVQGSNLVDIETCYAYMDKVANADKIAFSFDSKFYELICPHRDKLMSWMMGRRILLAEMLAKGLINTNKPHHLLGASYVEEFKFYNEEDYGWIDSVDTSSPVVCGMKGVNYNMFTGNSSKPSEKLYTLINADPSGEQRASIWHNIDIFKKMCNRNWYK